MNEVRSGVGDEEAESAVTLVTPVIVKAGRVIVKNPLAINSSALSVIRCTNSEEYRPYVRAEDSMDGDSSDSSAGLAYNSVSSAKTDDTEPFSPLSLPSFKGDDPDDGADCKIDDRSPCSSVGHRENPRDARNKAEKQRRDKLNGSINELASLVPLVAESPRKIDKTGVLRLTAHDLRKEHVFGDSMSPCHMKIKPRIAEAFVDMMGGCLFTATYRGIILVISANIEQYLGHCQTDLLGQNILNLTHPDDVEKFKKNLMPSETPMGPNGQLLAFGSEGGVKDYIQNEKPRDFEVRLARAVQRSEPPQYELCKVNGSLRRADRATPGGSLGGQIVRRHRARGEEAISPSGNDVVFIGMIHLFKPSCLTDRLIEASKQEYRTRHLVDGRIVQCDQRISVVAGYLTNEVSGVSAFTFMHKEDVRWVIIALRQMYDRSKQFGESCYRLISRTGDFIYLKTTGYLEISQGTNAIESFVCTNTLVSEDEGRVLIEKMKEKYSVIINTTQAECPFDSSDEASVEDPLKLEQVIMHLITNLPSPGTPLSHRSPSPSNSTPISHSLSIIPPKPSTIKTTIAKSVSVINRALKQKAQEENSASHTYWKNLNSVKQKDIGSKITRPSVVHRHNPEIEALCHTYKKTQGQTCDIYTLVKPSTSTQSSQDSVIVKEVNDTSRIPTASPKIYHTLSVNEAKPNINQKANDAKYQPEPHNQVANSNLPTNSLISNVLSANVLSVQYQPEPHDQVANSKLSTNSLISNILPADVLSVQYQPEPCDQVVNSKLSTNSLISHILPTDVLSVQYQPEPCDQVANSKLSTDSLISSILPADVISVQYQPERNDQDANSKLSTNSLINNVLSVDVSSVHLPIVPDTLTLGNYETDFYGINSFMTGNDILNDPYPTGLESIDTKDGLIHIDLKPNVVNSKDVLVSSLQALEPEDAFPELSTSFDTSSLGVLKRGRNDVNEEINPDLACKRRMPQTATVSIVTSALSQNSELLSKDSLEDLTTKDQEGLDSYINQLTDPNSDLYVVVPRSLAALESSMTQMDGRVVQLHEHQARYQQGQQHDLSEIMMEHQEHKQMFQSIQLEHRNTVSDDAASEDGVPKGQSSPVDG